MMTYRARLLALALCLSLTAATAARAAGNEVTGSYRVEQVTDLGPQVRVTLHIRLLNNSLQELSITRIAFRDMHRGGKPAESSAWARLQPREGATVEQQFVVPRAEYQRWSKGTRPMLQVAFQPAGGREVMRTIQLRRLPARRPQ